MLKSQSRVIVLTDDGYNYLRPPSKSELVPAIIVTLCAAGLALGVMYAGEKYLGCAPDEERTDYHNICVNKDEAEVQIVAWLDELGGKANVNQLSKVTGYNSRLIEDLDFKSDRYYCWRKEEGFMAWNTICELERGDSVPETN